ncbi:Ccl26 [Phodopus roborovskii]|uniref:Ccl26 protein n=2 Tax=Phodopus roborovskii TaxID=109678 RepID=A0AAV0A4B9_PHORO|nr:Ccl26 [Phodopus roborovskii]
MKTFSLSPIVLLTLFLSVHLGAATCESEMSRPCCLSYHHMIIPWDWVYTYELAKTSCSHEFVILTTKRGKKICVQPQAKWVQRYISRLKAQKHAGVLAQGSLN